MSQTPQSRDRELSRVKTPRSAGRLKNAGLLTLGLGLALASSSTAAADGESSLRRRIRSFRERLKDLRKEQRMERRLVLSELRGAIRNLVDPVKPSWREATHGKGSLSLGPGGLPILRLRGTPEEIGAQHGTLLKREIGVLVHRYLPGFLGTELAKARRDARRFLPHIPEARVRELRAMAKAAGVSFDDVLLAQTFADQYRAWGCSCVTATGDARPAGPAFGRNLDFIDMGFLHRFSLIVVIEPTGGRRVASVSFPGLCGVISGMNEDGLAAAVMVVHTGSGCATGTPFGLLFREVLERCDKTSKVPAVLSGSAVTVTNNLMVCDADGDARVFELDHEAPRCVERRPDEAGLLYSTNHFNAKSRREPRLSYVYFNSLKRMRDLRGCCRGKVDLGEIRQGLRKTAPTIANVQSMIFEPKDGRLHLSVGKKPAAKKDYVKLTREDLFPGRE